MRHLFLLLALSAIFSAQAQKKPVPKPSKPAKTFIKADEALSLATRVYPSFFIGGKQVPYGPWQQLCDSLIHIAGGTSNDSWCFQEKAVYEGKDTYNGRGWVTLIDTAIMGVDMIHDGIKHMLTISAWRDSSFENMTLGGVEIARGKRTGEMICFDADGFDLALKFVRKIQALENKGKFPEAYWFPPRSVTTARRPNALYYEAPTWAAAPSGVQPNGYFSKAAYLTKTSSIGSGPYFADKNATVSFFSWSDHPVKDVFMDGTVVIQGDTIKAIRMLGHRIDSLSKLLGNMTLLFYGTTTYVRRIEGAAEGAKVNAEQAKKWDSATTAYWTYMASSVKKMKGGKK